MTPPADQARWAYEAGIEAGRRLEREERHSAEQRKAAEAKAARDRFSEVLLGLGAAKENER